MLRFSPVLLVFLSMSTIAASGQVKMAGTQPSPDGRFALSVVCLGADGHEYADNSEKECGISVRQRDAATNTFEKRVYLRGAAIIWNVNWGEAGNVEVDLLECASSCFRPEQTGRSLLHLHLVIEKATGQVREIAGAT